MPGFEVTREVFWNIPEGAVALFYLASVLALGALARLLWARHARVWISGRGPAELIDLPGRVRSFLVLGIVQRKVLADPSAAAMHTLIYAGFLMLFVATCTVMIEERTSLRPIHGLGFVLFEIWGNTGGVLFLAGIALALHRRLRLRQPHLPHGREDTLLLALLASLGITGFLVQGARIAATGDAWSASAYVGWSLASVLVLFGGGEIWRPVHQALWTLHVALVVVFFVTLPATKLAHLLIAPANLFFRPVKRGGALAPISTPAEPPPLGLTRFADLSWKLMMEYSACTRCGRCDAVCPAHQSGKPLSPREVVSKMGAEARQACREGQLSTAVPVSVSPEELWACTACGACSEACPVSIRPLDTVVALRRSQVWAGRVSPTVARMLEGLQRYGNPWGKPPSSRTEWAQGLGVPTLVENSRPEILYWVGCSGAYDPTGQEVARAVASLLKAGGVDLAILGTEERCTGDAARRIGEEGLFQLLARRNVDTLNGYGVKRIVTHCPHCLNSLRNEYPAFGGNYEVVHHSRLLGELIAEGRLKPRKRIEAIMTYHDPCYLGRHNGEYEAPRSALVGVAAGGVVEMGRAREGSFCCGGGGGQMWMDGGPGERINYPRFDEAAGTGAELIATGCPFCKVMLDSSAQFRGVQDRVKVKDIAQIVGEAL